MPHAIWTTPIGADAELVPAGIPVPDELIEELVVFVLAPSAPQVAGYTNAVGWDSGDRADETDIIPDIDFPIPSTFFGGLLAPTFPDTPNNPAAILLADSVTMFESQPFHRATEGGNITFFEGAAQYLYDWTAPDAGLEGAHGGSAMNAFFGIIYSGTPGVTDMTGYGGPFKILLNGAAMSAENDGFRWPATTADSGFETDYTGSVPACRMGSLLCLAPDFNVEGLETPMGQWLAEGFKYRGAYVVDQRVDNAMAICVAYGPGGDGLANINSVFGRDIEQDLTDTGDAFARDMNVIIPALMVVNNNAEGVEGGGGQPVVDGGGGDDDETTFGSYRLGDWTPTPDEYPDFQSEYDRGVHPKKARFQPIGYKGEISQWLGEAGKKYRYHQFVREDRAAELEAYLASLEGAEFNIVGARPDLSVMVTLDNADITWTGRTPGDVFLTPVIHPSLDLDYAYWWEVTIDMTGTGSAAPVWTNPAPLPD